MSRADVDAVSLELIRNALDVAALEMQATVERSAHSQGIREVGDVSSSLFDPHGRLVAQAIALPVQLGGSSVALKEVLRAFPPEQMRPGDVFILNDPFHGGSHAPDLILTTPYHHRGTLVGFGCCYAHHQDVGGMSPGSLPPLSTEIYQEGILVPPLRLVEAGRTNETLIGLLLANTRLGDSLLGDLQAQLAALRVGGERLDDVLHRFGPSTVADAMNELLARTEAGFRGAVSQLPQGRFTAEDYLDDDGFAVGQPVRLRVAVTVAADQLGVDFTGTDPQVRGSLNCPLASTLSAVYAVLKVIVDPHDLIPNNEGVYSAIDVTVPEGCLLHPRRPGSVSSRPETQMRIANVVMGALAPALPDRVMAQDSGQMAVAILSGEHPGTGRRFVKVEAIVGGWGGRPGLDGPDALDTLVSNLSNTPVEAMEVDLPLRVERYELRVGSGGAGQYRGGLGVRRDIRALAPMELAVRAERQTIAPHGLFGGRSAQTGRWLLTRAGRTPVVLRCKQAGIDMAPGDVLTILTPGGGGYGPPEERSPAALAEDLRAGRVSLSAARREYGAVAAAAREVSRRGRPDRTGKRAPGAATGGRQGAGQSPIDDLRGDG